MTLAVKVALNPNTTNQPTNQYFLDFSTMFSVASTFLFVRSRDCVVRGLMMTKHHTLVWLTVRTICHIAFFLLSATKFKAEICSIVKKVQDLGGGKCIGDIFMPRYRKIGGHIVLPSPSVHPSVCPSIHLSVCLSAQT